MRSVGQHVEAVVAWLLRAQAASGDDGVSAGYHLLRDTWLPSYPETTGYIIPTLLQDAQQHANADARTAALRMAEYLLRVQTPEGAIRGWRADAPPYVFDTGQALFGWLAALQEACDGRYEEALVRAADWLVAQQDPAGFWARHQYGGQIRVWDARVAWPLVLVGQALARPAYVEAGHRFLEWALTQQRADGWLERASMTSAEPPVTHTIAYAVEAMLEVGLLLQEERYIQFARRAADALLARQRPNGSLSAYWAPGWRPLSRASCLTGDAQMALCWLRLYQHTGEPRYREAGARALAFVASTQRLDDRWPPIQGAVAGSWPIWGRYMRCTYPNWAAKFLLDALLLWQKVCTDSGKEA